jgi:DNA-binding CsgD family transcriptional regulator
MTEEQKNIYEETDWAVALKNLDSVYVYANKAVTELCGFKNPEDFKGRTDFDLPCGASNCATIFREQDKIVIESKKKLEILDIHPYGTGWKAYILTKTPLWNCDETNIIGTIARGIDITTEPVINLFKILSKRLGVTDSNKLVGQNSMVLSKNINEPDLTVQQTEILFFTLFGKTSKEISKILSVTSNVVLNTEDQLKTLFKAGNKAELIDKAYSLGLEKLIPKSLFNKQLSVILDT